MDGVFERVHVFVYLWCGLLVCCVYGVLVVKWVCKWGRGRTHMGVCEMFVLS